MPQICVSFPDDLYNEIDLRATSENTSKPKIVVSLITKAIQDTERLASELKEVNEKLGIALLNQQQLQNEILPVVKLLTPAPKRTLRERILNRHP